VGASPPSQLALCKIWEGILVNDKTMEFSKDRLNKQIRDLVRENEHLKDSLFRKDYELNQLRRQMEDADKTSNFLSITMGIILVAFIVFALYAVKLASGA
jgi:predicted RNase H-like nuclease (RuvC/YqgF family)